MVNIYDTGWYTVDKPCHNCGEIIPANKLHYVQEKIPGSNILNFHVCEKCHYDVYESELGKCGTCPKLPYCNDDCCL